MSTGEPRQKSWWGRNWFWVVPLGCLTPIVCVVGCVVLSVMAVFGLLRSSEAYTRSLAAVTENAQVQAALGEPIQPGTFVTGNVNVSNNGGHADIHYSVSGPKGDGSVHVVADKQNGAWVFSTNRVVLNPTQEEIDVPVSP
jgi:cytochrome oxidase complex assembly protein 1